MNETKFRELMRELSGYYKKTKEDFTPAVMGEYRSACVADDASYERLFKAILREFKWFPTVGEFLSVCDRFRTKTVMLRNTEKCFYCLDVGTIPYIKKGIPPFADIEYEFRATCPMCNAGQHYFSWPRFDQIFSRDTLEEVKQKNLDRFGNITVDEIEASKIKARSHMSGFGVKL